MVGIDTHAVVKRLMAAGFNTEQAEAVTLVVRESQDIDLSSLATKDDVRLVREDLRLLREDLRVGLGGAKTDLAEAKSEILKWIVGAVGIQTVAILGAVMALIRVIGH